MFHNIYILLLNLDIFSDDIAFQNGFIYTCAKFTKKNIFYLPSKYDKISVKVISTFNGDRKNPST